MRLTEMHIPQAKFDGCDLTGATFTSCDLRHVSFRGAMLIRVTFGGCMMEGTDFTDAAVENLGYADEDPNHLTPEKLATTRSYQTGCLKGTHVSGGNGWEPKRVFLDLRGADLRKALLMENLDYVDLTDADISGANVQSSLRFDQLASTRTFRTGVLTGVRLYGTVMQKADLSGMVLDRSVVYFDRSTKADDILFVGPCRVSGHFGREELKATRNYRLGDLAGMQFQDIDLIGFDLSGMNLTGCRFDRSCRLAGADLTDAVITGAAFMDRYAGSFAVSTFGLSLEQIKSTWNYKHGRMEGIELPEPIAASMRIEAAAKKLEANPSGAKQ